MKRGSHLLFLFFFLIVIPVCLAGAVAVFPSRIVFEEAEETINVRNNIEMEAEYCVTAMEKECFTLAGGETRELVIQPMEGKIIIEEYLDDEIVNAVEIFAFGMEKAEPNKFNLLTISIIFAAVFALAVVSIILGVAWKLTFS